MEIRSYRRVFDLERRIYRVDRMRLNPGGIPVRGVVYFIVILAVAVIVQQLPLLGAAERALPWYLRDLALPWMAAALLTVIRVEGRPFHLAAYAIARHRTGSRRLAGVRSHARAGGRWRPEQIVMLPDGSDARMRRLRFTGPGAVVVSVEHERAEARTGLTLRERPGRRALSQRQVIALAAGARLLVRSGATPAACSEDDRLSSRSSPTVSSYAGEV